ncbi:HlyD family efflux transporter periplasmic adaptor subunit [uncultured Zoogloea sp.]|uniref:HlyD family secretion protein n=1 Tax=uncultured Zoogloea sp. TaxID=160237 RepID=UPI0026107BB0|nr:HlyD family efflux transporter periplasmic adaptor subunit [uncultured Zoogloea sp.]
MARRLFRDEALKHSQIQPGGSIQLAQPLSLRYVTAFVVVFICALIFLLVKGEYTRKERVTGITMVSAGTVRLTAPEAGVVTRRLVSDGDPVKAGQVLFELGQDRRSDLGDTQRLVEDALEAQRNRIDKEIGLRVALANEGSGVLRQQRERLRSELQLLDAEIGLQSEQVAVARTLTEKLRPLFEERIVPEVQYQQQMSAYLEQRSRLETLKRSRVTLEGQLSQTVSQLRQEALRANSEETALERSGLANDQERFIRRGARLTRITATVDGVATAILLNTGQVVEAGASLGTLVPEGSAIEVHLFVPSRAMGFVRPGQAVRLRYDAFPYQKFGQYKGVVTAVSAVNVPSRDLQGHFPFLADKGETFFRLTVHPDDDYVKAYGKDVLLRPGLTLQADIDIESKPLISWILDPLLAVGKSF